VGNSVFSVRQISAMETQPLRHRVLWPHKPDVASCTIDIDQRADAIHLGAYDLADVLVGVCSLFEMATPKLEGCKQFRLRAMATAPEVRGSGAGKAIVLEALRLTGGMGADLLWCDARKVALNFYSACGFSEIDEWYEIPIIGPHKLMYFRFS
jgi:predicted GNAT family N-acyltransferase